MIELINDETVLSNMIKQFNAQKFDQLRIAGGTSKDMSFYAGVLPAKYYDDYKKTFFHVVPYSSQYHKNGEGSNNKRLDEIPEETALRELFEETGIFTTKEKLILASEKFVPDNRYWMHDTMHRKQFFVTDDFDTSNIFTHAGPNKISAETMPSICVSANLLVDVLYFKHLDAMKGSVDVLILKDIKYYNSLQGIIGKINKRQSDYYESMRLDSK